jgi:cell division protein ZapA (FtsZ GTPase activity inhibitor)
VAREKVDVEIARRKFTVERDDLDALSILAVSKDLERRLAELQSRTGVVDTGRLAVMLALDIACDMRRLQGRLDDGDKTQEGRLEGMIILLEKALQQQP